MTSNVFHTKCTNFILLGNFSPSGLFVCLMLFVLVCIFLQQVLTHVLEESGYTKDSSLTISDFMKVLPPYNLRVSVDLHDYRYNSGISFFSLFHLIECLINFEYSDSYILEESFWKKCFTMCMGPWIE